jgi:dephospho-CoA kinase
MQELFDKSLIIIRGLPGSGKSTLAKLLSENGKYPVYSVDDYFTDSAGNYTFEFSENYKAYALCEMNCTMAMQAAKEKVFIDNVFGLEWEIEPYIKLAKEYSYSLFVMTVEKMHEGQNVHGIELEQIQRMAEKYQVKLM